MRNPYLVTCMSLIKTNLMKVQPISVTVKKSAFQGRAQLAVLYISVKAFEGRQHLLDLK